MLDLILSVYGYLFQHYYTGATTKNRLSDVNLIQKKRKKNEAGFMFMTVLEYKIIIMHVFMNVENNRQLSTIYNSFFKEKKTKRQIVY